MLSRRLFVTLLAMTVGTLVPEATFAATVARPITGAQVIKMLYAFPATEHAIVQFGEVSEAIAKAATEDPLFPEREDGAEVTAAVLVALAWHESKFVPSIVGDHGKSFGLYQIQPPTARVDSKLLTVASQASYVAIDLIRTSFRHCMRRKRPWREGLAWYAASSESGSLHPKVVAQSVSRMNLAAHLMTKFFAPAPLHALLGPRA